MDGMVTINSMIYGIYELKYPIDCNYDLLDKTFEIKVGGVVCEMMFPSPAPSLVEDISNGKLSTQQIPGPVCPDKSLGWGNKQDGFGGTSWGRTTSFPKGETTIKQLLIRVNLSEESSMEQIQDMYSNIDKWFERFYDIKEIITKKPNKKLEPQLPHLIQGGGFRHTGLMLYAYDCNDKKYFSLEDKVHKVHLTLDIPVGDFTFKICSKVVSYANKQREIKFDYKYYLEGFRAFYLGDYIKTVAMCSPALESALLYGIKVFAGEKGIYFLDKLLGKYRMLGGYFALAEDLEMDLPTNDYRDDLLKLRNKVIHKGYTPTKEEAEKFIKDVGIYITAFSSGILE